MRTKPNLKTCMLSSGLALGLSWAMLPGTLSAQSGPDGARTSDGFIVKNGQIYQLRNGQATPLGQDAVMRITPAGEITGFDGQQRRLNENTVLTMDGRVLPAPPGVVFATPQPAAGPESQTEDRFSQSRAPQRAVSGENISGLATGRSSSQTPAAANNGTQDGQTAFSATPPTGEMKRDNQQGGDNTTRNTGGVVDPVTGLPVATGGTGTLFPSSSNQTTTGSASSNQGSNMNQSNTPDQSGRGVTDAGEGNVVNSSSQTAGQNALNNTSNNTGNTNSSANMNSNATQQPQGFSRQGVGTYGESSSTGSGPASRPNSTNANATQGGNAPNDRVNSSNASGGASGSARSTSSGSSSSSSSGGSGSSSGGSAGSGSGSSGSGGSAGGAGR